MTEILRFPQKTVEQYYLKISGDEHFMPTTEYTKDVVFPFIIEHGVLEDLEQIRKVG